MKKVGKLLLVSLVILSLVFSLVGCSGQQAGQSNTPTPAPAEKPVLNVASQTTYPPFEFVENNEYVGFDMDLIRAIGAAEGFDVKITSLGFDALIPAVRAGTVDCCISAMTIKESGHRRLILVNLIL